ncbi:MAG: hypothetical protein AAB393_15965 [Bacteroidota bacterium]
MSQTAILRARLLASATSFTMHEAKQYIDDVLKTGAADDDKRFHKRFSEEFWPLVTVADSLADTRILVEFAGSGSSIDATLVFDSDRLPQQIELTAAIDGHQEALQDEHMEIYGSAPLTVKIAATKNKNSKQQRIEETMPDWQSADDFNNELLSRVKSVVAEKCAKAVSRAYYKGAWLGVVIPNFPPKERKKRFTPMFTDFLSNSSVYEPFSRVFVVSTVGDYFFDTESLRPSSSSSEVRRSSGPSFFDEAQSVELSMEQLSKRFDAAMLEIYQRAKSEAGYNASVFLQMLHDRRGVATAKYLINASKPSDGYTNLYRLGRLDLTVEAVLIENVQWHPLFTEDELDKARRRLAEYRYRPA